MDPKQEAVLPIPLMAAFNPGVSPPEVRTPMCPERFFAVISYIYYNTRYENKGHSSTLSGTVPAHFDYWSQIIVVLKQLEHGIQ
jgi:hypothetical protein